MIQYIIQLVKAFEQGKAIHETKNLFSDIREHQTCCWINTRWLCPIGDSQGFLHQTSTS